MTVARIAAAARRASRRSATLALLGVAAGGAGCQTPPAALAPLPCGPVSGSLAADAPVERLDGAFRLALVATAGPRAGHSTTGELRLQRNAGAGPQGADGVSYPLYGSARIALDSVGAVAPGDPASTNPARPGVLVVRWTRGDAAHPTPMLTLRLGDEGNRTDVTRFDGAHLALSATTLSAERFAGSWDSGVGMERAAGYFCAVRTTVAPHL
jgi:hypothetical protein